MCILNWPKKKRKKKKKKSREHWSKGSNSIETDSALKARYFSRTIPKFFSASCEDVRRARVLSVEQGVEGRTEEAVNHGSTRSSVHRRLQVQRLPRLRGLAHGVSASAQQDRARPELASPGVGRRDGVPGDSQDRRCSHAAHHLQRVPALHHRHRCHGRVRAQRR